MTTTTMSSSSPSLIKKVALICGNALMTIGWIRVWYTLLVEMQFSTNQTEPYCQTILYPRLVQALMLSTIELLHSLLGFSRSKPWMVFMFLCVRDGVEYFCGPPSTSASSSSSPSCFHWTHLFTVGCWSMGETIRFGCFTLVELFPNYSETAKFIRYNVGPILFPLGALGEMTMVARVALLHNNDYRIWFAVSLWPIGFYPLMTQLLKQRRKFLTKLSQEQTTKNKENQSSNKKAQ